MNFYNIKTLVRVSILLLMMLQHCLCSEGDIDWRERYKKIRGLNKQEPSFYDKLLKMVKSDNFLKMVVPITSASILSLVLIVWCLCSRARCCGLLNCIRMRKTSTTSGNRTDPVTDDVESATGVDSTTSDDRAAIEKTEITDEVRDQCVIDIVSEISTASHRPASQSRIDQLTRHQQSNSSPQSIASTKNASIVVEESNLSRKISHGSMGPIINTSSLSCSNNKDQVIIDMTSILSDATDKNSEDKTPRQSSPDSGRTQKRGNSVRTQKVSTSDVLSKSSCNFSVFDGKKEQESYSVMSTNSSSSQSRPTSSYYGSTRLSAIEESSRTYQDDRQVQTHSLGSIRNMRKQDQEVSIIESTNSNESECRSGQSVRSTRKSGSSQQKQRILRNQFVQTDKDPKQPSHQCCNMNVRVHQPPQCTCSSHVSKTRQSQQKHEQRRESSSYERFNEAMRRLSNHLNRSKPANISMTNYVPIHELFQRTMLKLHDFVSKKQEEKPRVNVATQTAPPPPTKPMFSPLRSQTNSDLHGNDRHGRQNQAGPSTSRRERVINAFRQTIRRILRLDPAEKGVRDDPSLSETINSQQLSEIISSRQQSNTVAVDHQLLYDFLCVTVQQLVHEARSTHYDDTQDFVDKLVDWICECC